MNWSNKLLVIGLLFFTQSCQQQTQENIEGELNYAHPESLIEVEELKNNLDKYVLIDLRREDEYDQGHLPEALQVWRTDITDTSYTYGGMMPRKEQLEKLLGSLGITPTDTIVIYDDKAECDAARLWWIMKFYGHDDVKLLNGGLVSWEEAGGPVTQEKPEIVRADYQFVKNADSAIYSDMDMLAQLIEDSSSIVLLDTRTHDEYSGAMQKSGAAKAGKIPTAINLDWAVAVDLNGNHKFRSAKEIKSTYDGIGMHSKTPVVTYCHSGVRSAHTLFVLTQLLGYDNVRNYDGSWTEWSHLTADTLAL